MKALIAAQRGLQAEDEESPATLLGASVHGIDAQNVALRLVSLTDRLYDAGIPVVASGAKLDSIFSDEMLAGGYRKKYLRATSRLLALTAEVNAPHGS